MANNEQSFLLSRVVENLNYSGDLLGSKSTLRSLTRNHFNFDSIVESRQIKFSNSDSKLVGREKELKQMSKCFERMRKSEKPELVVIHGTSGSGKSTVVQAFTQNLPSETFCVQGKFDQLQSHTPYSGRVAATDQLCRQILKQPNCGDIRNRIRAFMGTEVYLLANLIPAMMEVTDFDNKNKIKKADADPLKSTIEGGMAKSFIRFKILFRAFLLSVASLENPLLFFLDDLQWADIALLDVLKSIVTDNWAQNIMILCAYLEGEMSTDILRQYRLFDDDIGITMVSKSIRAYQ
jgi:predicted ATPase